ncbi:secretory calcium-binding phosphoprotein 7 [Morone saxatilis]|uniref:secretory calcium-binding phosphoprotein 7 n=1 Tax=Morone saxatilis TaxID=34816 RepID=UPI0015E22945|nr:secretory calcium-binding phosphoprotein 7 [Morone saxatilis]
MFCQQINRSKSLSSIHTPPQSFSTRVLPERKASFKMKLILLAACILGMAFCAPPQMYMEFDIHHAPVEAAQAIPAGVPAGSLEVLLPVDAQRQPLGGPVRGFIKQEIPQPNGRETKEVFYPFGFDPAAPAAPAAAAPVADPIVPAAAAPAAPIAPAAPAAPVAPAAPAAPAAPVVPVIAASAPAAKPSGDDDDDDDD